MRLFWRILAAIGGLLLLLIVAVAIAVRTIDVNTFIAPMQKRVKDATGRDLVIRGGIDFKLGLEPELIIDDVSLSNSDWGRSPQLLTAKRVEAQVKLLPLLRRQFEIVRFKLIDPVISLETNASGKGNWEFGSGADASAPAPSTSGLNAFTIGDLAIDHGTASYSNGESGKTTEVVIDELSLHSRNADAPVSARFRGTVGGLAVALEGDLGPLQALAQRRWPYPVALKGEVNGQTASVATKLRVEGKTVNLDELQIGAGNSAVQGQLALTPGAVRPKMSFKLASATLAWSDLPFVHKVVDASKGPEHGKFVFSDQPLDLAVLQAADADGDISVGTLRLPDGRHLDNVRIQFTLHGSKLEVPLLEASAFGGNARGRLSIDASPGHAPALTLHGEAKALDAGALLEMVGMKRQVRGGNTDLTIDVVAHGDSPRQWARGVSGNVTAVVGTATLVHTKIDLDSPLNRLADAVNPFHRVDASTELECAVARLPLKDGVAQIDRSIALETKKFGASVSGTMDLRDETLDLTIKPQVRHGIPIDVPQVASLVRFQGPLRSPAVRIDAGGSAVAVAKIGAAIYSGGLSLLGESLLSAAVASGEGPCRVALAQPAGTAAPSAPAPVEPSSSSRAANPIANALDRVFSH